eukprot:scaffold12788_cov138-Skeletonema_menzelii.AAC.1
MLFRQNAAAIIVALRLLLLLKCATTANSFLHQVNNVGGKIHPHRNRCHAVFRELANANIKLDAQRGEEIQYGMAGVDLYSKWIALVDQGHVTATT